MSEYNEEKKKMMQAGGMDTGNVSSDGNEIGENGKGARGEARVENV